MDRPSRPSGNTYVCPTCGKPLFEWDPKARLLTSHGCRVWLPEPGSAEPGRVYCGACGAYAPSVPANLLDLLQGRASGG